MIGFIKKTTYFFIPLIVIIFTSEYIVNTGLQQSNYGELAEWKEITNGGINADIIINGSSRAQSNVSPIILDSIININSYNLGVNAYLFSMEYSCYRYYREKNKIKPKLIVQILGNSTLSKRKDLYDAYQFYPYLKEKIIHEATEKYNGHLSSDKIIPFLRYAKNPNLINIGVQEFFKIKEYKKNKYKGFRSSNKK